MEIPPRRATDDYLKPMGRSLDIACDIDVGEIVENHHLVIRGLERAPQGAMLHYELVPGASFEEWHARGPESFAWMVYASDDVGTVYRDNNSGAFGHASGAAAHGVRDVGAAVPSDARMLELRFESPFARPRPGYPRSMVVDLVRGEMTLADNGGRQPGRRTAR